MTKRTKIPRASIQVGILDDEDFILLTDQERGLEAFGFFVALIVLTKDMDLEVVPYFAMKRRLGINQNEIKTFSKMIQEVCESNGNDSWVIEHDNGLEVRNYDRWNPVDNRGGTRTGAGRKSKRNQNEIKMESKVVRSVTDSVTDSDTNNKKACRPAALTPTVEDKFDLFWGAYPKKTGKGAARKAFAKIKFSKAPLHEILAAVEQQKSWAQWKEEDGRFIPNPATWINQERWTDEPPSVQAAPTAPKPKPYVPDERPQITEADRALASQHVSAFLGGKNVIQ